MGSLQAIYIPLQVDSKSNNFLAVQDEVNCLTNYSLFSNLRKHTLDPIFHKYRKEEFFK